MTIYVLHDLGKTFLYVLQDGGRNHIWMVTPKPYSSIFLKFALFAEVTIRFCSHVYDFLLPDNKFSLCLFSTKRSRSIDGDLSKIDADGDTVRMNLSATLVIARKEFLGNLCTYDRLQVLSHSQLQLVIQIEGSKTYETG